jgi:hypothetical protein
MYSALRATSKTLANFLEQCLKTDSQLSSFFSGGSMIVSLNTPEEMKTADREGLSVWLYRVVRDESRLNDPPRRIDVIQVLPPPLPLRLHYLITPVTEKKQGAGPETEQLVLGKVLQCLYTHPTLHGADLKGELAGSDAEIYVRLEPMSLEEIARVWDALDASYQLSVSYEVTLANILPETEPERVTPVDVALPDYGVIVS